MDLQRLDRALVQQGAQGPGHIGRLPHFRDGGGNRPGQFLTAKSFFKGYGIPSPVDKGLIGLCIAIGQAHHAIFNGRPLLVAGRIDRG